MTPRALILGLLLALIVGALGPLLSLYIQGPNSSAYFTSQIAHFILFLLVAFVSVGLGSIRRSWAFEKGELLVMFIFMSLANATHIIIAHWVSLGSSPFITLAPRTTGSTRSFPTSHPGSFLRTKRVSAASTRGVLGKPASTGRCGSIPSSAGCRFSYRCR